MVQPDQLRILANEWRNFAEYARKLHRQQVELGVGGAANGLVAVENASAQAAALDERAYHLELTIARGGK